MHILSSGDEEQAVEFGHAFNREVKILPPVTKKLMRLSQSVVLWQGRVGVKDQVHIMARTAQLSKETRQSLLYDMKVSQSGKC